MDDKPTMDPKTICLEDLGKIIEQGSYTTSNEDYAAVDWASKNRNLEIVKYLVAQGKDIHAMTGQHIGQGGGKPGMIFTGDV